MPSKLLAAHSHPDTEKPKPMPKSVVQQCFLPYCALHASVCNLCTMSLIASSVTDVTVMHICMLLDCMVVKESPRCKQIIHACSMSLLARKSKRQPTASYSIALSAISQFDEDGKTSLLLWCRGQHCPGGVYPPCEAVPGGIWRRSLSAADTCFAQWQGRTSIHACTM